MPSYFKSSNPHLTSRRTRGGGGTIRRTQFKNKNHFDLYGGEFKVGNHPRTKRCNYQKTRSMPLFAYRRINNISIEEE